MEHRSKWDIMNDQYERLDKEAKALLAEILGMQRTPFTANGTGKCSSCGDVLPTEADFAKHFLVEDEQFLNLGYCPKARLDKQLQKLAENEARRSAQKTIVVHDGNVEGCDACDEIKEARRAAQ
jgi:hypothetical protein